MTRTVLPKSLSPGLEAVGEIAAEQPRLTPLEKAAFLELICIGSNQHRAAKAIGVTMLQIARERMLDSQFADDLMTAKDMRVEAMEELAIEFATRGNLRDVYHNGLVVGDEVVHGPHNLLQFLLKGNMRDKYGVERTEVRDTTSDAPPVIRNDGDAKRLLAKLRGNALLPPIDVAPLPAKGRISLQADSVDDLL